MADPPPEEDGGPPGQDSGDRQQPNAGREDYRSVGQRQADESGGLSFRLPPFRLPEFFPPDYQIRLPVPGLRPTHRIDARTLLVACLVFDVVDAALALTVGAPLVGVVRSTGGLILAGVFADVLGLLYGWELLAVLLGVPELTVVPTLTILLLVHARNSGTSSREEPV